MSECPKLFTTECPTIVGIITMKTSDGEYAAWSAIFAVLNSSPCYQGLLSIIYKALTDIARLLGREVDDDELAHYTAAAAILRERIDDEEKESTEETDSSSSGLEN